MFGNDFYSFKNNDKIVTNKHISSTIQNTFTIEFWARPEASHAVSIAGAFKRRFVISPASGGDASLAELGVSVGTNGVTVYEHTTNGLSHTLIHPASIKLWTHIAVVYQEKVPSLYMDGQFVKTSTASTNNTVVPSAVFGGMDPDNFYMGDLKEIRIWNTARTHEQLAQNMHRIFTGSEPGLFGYWRLNEGNGTKAFDLTKNKNNGTITVRSAAPNPVPPPNPATQPRRRRNRKTVNHTPAPLLNATTPNNQANNQMNILFTFFIPSGGVETLNRQRYYALKEQGVNCHFLYTQSGTGLQNNTNIPVFVTNKDKVIKNTIVKGNYSAIIVNSDLTLLKKIREFGYRGILIYENQGLGLNKEYVEEYIQTHGYPIINDYCDAILYPKTPHLVQAFSKYFPNKKQFSFHNSFNTKEFHYRPLPKQDHPIIGWVGRLEENKNWRDFLAIGARMIQDNPTIQLWMFEDQTLSTKEERAAFKAETKRLHLGSNLTVYTNQPHAKMADHFSIIGDSGGFLCSTSKVEGFGYAVLEAMICKCPVLSTDSDGVRSFLTHNITGKFYAFGNIDEAFNEGKDLITNKGLRKTIIKNAVKHIEQHFSSEAYAENFLNMLKQLSPNN
ncbi:glycosyltransferase [Radiobacillus sp. PE A8.2]|uniref:glycosyltransferase n=1 Tax=Radiobacillus sp. PE A8.2 TaxID=3380349 RepID=UPI00388D6E4E